MNRQSERSRSLITIVFGALTIIVVMVLSVVGLEIVQRLVPAALRQEHNDVAGFIYAVVGVVYAVMLALVVVAVWEQHEEARTNSIREANELAEVFWLAHTMPESVGPSLQDTAEEYARVVVEEEWPLMAEGRFSPEASALQDEMRLDIQSLQVDSAKDEVVLAQAYDRMEELADARRTRLGEINEGIPFVLWVVLIYGGLITVGFTYLFGLSNTRSHRLMVAALAGMIALVLYTVAALDYPFTGISRVGPEPFEYILDRFKDSQLNLR